MSLARRVGSRCEAMLAVCMCRVWLALQVWYTLGGRAAKSKMNFANRYLVNDEYGWYLQAAWQSPVRKIVARGRSDARGHLCAITEDGVAHKFFNPPLAFQDYLFRLPVKLDEKRTMHNATGYYVKHHDSMPWRRIKLHGVGHNQEHTLHLFDEDDRWYRLPNDTGLREFLAPLPKAMALADNHKLVWSQERGGWFVSEKGKLLNITHFGHYVVNVRCDRRIWFGMRDPPLELAHYLDQLEQEIYDPYNFTLSDSQTYRPTTTP